METISWEVEYCDEGSGHCVVKYTGEDDFICSRNIKVPVDVDNNIYSVPGFLNEVTNNIPYLGLYEHKIVNSTTGMDAIRGIDTPDLELEANKVIMWGEVNSKGEQVHPREMMEDRIEDMYTPIEDNAPPQFQE